MEMFVTRFVTTYLPT